ncbi:hypothetical protein DEO72_LG10g2184 [Vigna unguiculata]|uniref:Uncharacterized protein n=1 Tax=Vigna unguiculata TaxID=3917 RepID=A0A4D6NDJ7_VIGUN|nr:hypothetical protein DEO72_LG10g2184 [Vigna unguiculata]
MVKIVDVCEKGDSYTRDDMACHIDDFISAVAHTHILVKIAGDLLDGHKGKTGYKNKGLVFESYTKTSNAFFDKETNTREVIERMSVSHEIRTPMNDVLAMAYNVVGNP